MHGHLPYGRGSKALRQQIHDDPGERGDIWHWKSVRSGSIGYIDDQWLDDTRWSEDASGAGRHSDPRDDGSYVNNVNEAGDGPAFMGPQGADGPSWIRDEDKVPFVDTFEAGDEIPGIIVKRPSGDRGQIGVAVFDNAQVRHAFQTSVTHLNFEPRATLVADRSWAEIKAQIDELRRRNPSHRSPEGR
ncbi:MAG: hypothetical protein CME24_06430 [Gemmatimonadetes bacterium]|nr:hypothetical protein [Gemmatimonadota bacterium]